MNYIKQLNAFYELLYIKPLNANSQCLYNILLHINNKCNWISEFTVANTLLMLLTGLNMSALQRARNNLVQKGYITYQKGKSNNAGYYSIIKLEQQSEQHNEQQSEQHNEQQNDNTTNNTTNTLNKLNKTKQNKTKLNNRLNEFNLYNNFDQNLECDCISKSTNEKCKRRSSYNINGKNYCNQHSRSIIGKYLNIKEKEKTEYSKLINDNFINEDIKNTIYSFIEMRKEIKKPLTVRGLELLIKKLYKLSGNVDEQIEILNNSIMNNWQGIFPLKQEKKQVNKGSFDDFKELWEEAKSEDEQAGNDSNNNSFGW